MWLCYNGEWINIKTWRRRERERETSCMHHVYAWRSSFLCRDRASLHCEHVREVMRQQLRSTTIKLLVLRTYVVSWRRTTMISSSIDDDDMLASFISTTRNDDMLLGTCACGLTYVSTPMHAGTTTSYALFLLRKQLTKSQGISQQFFPIVKYIMIKFHVIWTVIKEILDT